MRKLTIIFLTLLLFTIPSNASAAPKECCQITEESTYTLKTPAIKNEDISGIQKVLKELGFYDGRINGYYNSETKNAVEKFQKANKLNVNGTFDIPTRNKLIMVFEESPKKEVKPKGKVALIVNVDKKVIYVFEDNKIFKSFPVAVGKISTPSPIGDWSIEEIDKWPGGPYGSVWMAIKNPWGNYGIHGTDRPWSIGSNASGGCIRMNNHEVLELSQWVNIGTTVKITGTPYSAFYEERRHLNAGMNGADVKEVQRTLFEKGFYNFKIDGMWSWRTEKAIREFQKTHGFKDTGIVDEDLYAALGL